jgi:hypothetical protein
MAIVPPAIYPKTATAHSGTCNYQNYNMLCVLEYSAVPGGALCMHSAICVLAVYLEYVVSSMNGTLQLVIVAELLLDVLLDDGNCCWR